MIDIEQLKEIWGIYQRTQVVHCITSDGTAFFARPMSGVMLDGDKIYAATFKNSKKVAQSKSSGRAAFYFYDPEKFPYACLSGPAEIIQDRKLKEALWMSDWERYFKDGIDDENFVILKVHVENVDYVTQLG